MDSNNVVNQEQGEQAHSAQVLELEGDGSLGHEMHGEVMDQGHDDTEEEDRDTMGGIIQLYNDLPLEMQATCLKNMIRHYAHNVVAQGKNKLVQTFEEAVNDAIFNAQSTRHQRDEIDESSEYGKKQVKRRGPNKRITQKQLMQAQRNPKDRKGSGRKTLNDFICEVLEQSREKMSIAEIKDAVMAAGFITTSRNHHGLFSKYCSIMSLEGKIKGHTNGVYSALNVR